MFKSILLSFAVFAFVSAGSIEFQPKAGFEFVGTAEGKIFITPILPESEQYGISWQYAVQKCADAGYKMATITSQVQDDVIRNYITEGETSIDSRRWSWIDGTNFVSQDTWFSLNTGRNLTYFNWVSGRPSKSEGYAEKARCLRWSHNGSPGGYGDRGWWDVYCDDKHNVICETLVA